MRAGDEALEGLRAALAKLAAADAGEVLSQARAEARARVRAMLANVLADSMLDELRAHLDAAPGPPSDDPPDRGVAETVGWYVYGVARAASALPGDAGVELTAIDHDELAAIATEIPLSEFDETRLRRHLSDMAWVERTAREHERVLDAIRRDTTVVPMRMCTVYRDQDGVRDMLRREAESLGQALVHLEGRTEWGVKVFHDPASEQAPVVDEDLPSGTGTAYMYQRRLERDRDERAILRTQEACEEIFERLASVSADSVALPVQVPSVSGRVAEMVLNAACLVDDELEAAFREELEQLGARFSAAGLELELTGPWPAYNFVPGPIGAPW